jgi:catechol 2,3-dioxygenase-like lactoylglutathione lyase family enzyme
MSEKNKKAKIGFIYYFCNDLEETRQFYSDLLGMEEFAFQPEYNYLCYQSEGLQLIFFGSKDGLTIIEKWANQPGYEGGELETPSLSIAIPESLYRDVVNRLISEGVRAFGDKPEWRMDSYWGFTVKDPMGTTIEVYTIPEKKPEIKKWEE